MATQVEATAVGRLMGMAVIGGLSAREAIKTAKPLTRMAVNRAKRVEKSRRRELVQIANTVSAIEDEGLHHLYTPAQLHALYNAAVWSDIPALIAEYEAWEARGECCEMDLYDLGNEFAA